KNKLRMKDEVKTDLRQRDFHHSSFRLHSLRESKRERKHVRLKYTHTPRLRRDEDTANLQPDRQRHTRRQVRARRRYHVRARARRTTRRQPQHRAQRLPPPRRARLRRDREHRRTPRALCAKEERGDRKSTRLNSSHSQISYAVFCSK